ncbi:protein phosphatase 2C domain-containing protein [Aminobacter carboxidus]|uniref:Protein phosphatase 2C domain-containing protein n=1 Tax=Aminobacter carboxidus TaxID=376165 RepID=A0ABR9GTI4_9HYPH|nr:protein phosphatase 2C domain-containing protein [Aminobacter carboxidus]MBE1206873.1 protein phosphatase 2C domain-containing protein [Aminobacter carboxidus]
MPNIRIIDSITAPGSPSRPNEDSAGGNASCAFVIDGATGLGGTSIVGLHGSDAAWLARFAQSTFEELVRNGRAVADVVRELNQRVANVVHEAANALPIKPWNLPIASFQMARVEGEALFTHGLGDCRLFLVDADGTMLETSAIKAAYANERDGARKAIALSGGFSTHQALADAPVVREELRRRRAAYNQPSGSVWTLGTSPAAADHLVTEQLTVALPAKGLLCSDGFAALADQYGRYSAAELVRAAADIGLAQLLQELRHIEQVEDPDGQKFPRFKVSDDATAVLFEVVA